MGRKNVLDSKPTQNEPNRHLNYNRRSNSSNQSSDNKEESQKTNDNSNNQSGKINSLSTQMMTSIIDKEKSIVKLKTLIEIITALAPILIVLFIIIAIIFFILALVGEESTKIGSSNYHIKCEEITVIITDKKNNYEPVGLPETYDLDDYVAGVLAAEVAQLRNPELYKAFAVAARSYGLTHVDDSCTIESSDRKQVFRDITSRSQPVEQEIYEAVEATEGQVLIQGGELYSGSYDAFCSIAKDSEYYTIKQQGQKIPVSWVDSQRGIAESWKQGTCAGNHGRGMSQWGAYYLASEQGYTYEDLIEYYYGSDDVVIAKSGSMTYIAGLEIKDTINASYELDMPLTEFLAEKGSSIEEYNDFIFSNVNEAGAGTREGAITAAVSLINFLYDNFNAKLPYYWGGSYQGYGVNPSIGEYHRSMATPSGYYSYYVSFDCSGFVSWAIKNGGYNIGRLTTVGFYDKFSKDSCDIEDSSCTGELGDLINSYSGHVEMIIGIDEEDDMYYVAQSSGGGVAMSKRSMHTGNGNNTKILHLGGFYENSANVDKNYPQ